MASLSLPATMYAWRKHKGNKQPVWEKVPLPAVPSTGFLCRMLAAGVCHSDQAMLVDTAPRPWFQDKYTLGHEGCGEIVAIGSGVRDGDWKVGDIISMFAVPGCGRGDCSECSRDIPQLCQTGHHAGIGQDGFFAPYASIDARGAVLVPKGVSPAMAAVATDAVTTSFHAITRRAKVKASETVFIFGLGGLGFNGLQITKAIGARVIVSDVRQECLDAAMRIGIPKTDIVPVGKPIQDFVRENGLDDRIDTTIDFVGTNQTFEDAQQIVRRAGKMVCVGTLALDNTIHMKVGVRKRLEIIFSYGGQVQDLNEVLQMIAKGDLNPVVEDGLLEDFPKVLKDLCDGKVKGRMALKFSRYNDKE